ncbi:MAG: hypothetical protein HY811_08040 [Planctomycetes bacterium]|nr:hypothetical protein [Planctomycetota bacterium]
MVEFNGTAPALNISKGTNGTALSFNNLKVNIGATSVLQPNAALTIGGNLQVNAGEFDLNTGLNHSVSGLSTIEKTLDINGSQLTCSDNFTVSNQGSLILRDNAVLKIANNKAIAINGAFTTYWGGGGATKPKITTSGVIGTDSYSFDANSGSNIDISGLTVESVDASGLKINTGANILDIDDVAFASQAAPIGGAALNLQVTSGYVSTQSFTFSDMSFDGSYKGSAGGPSATIGNVVVADNAQGVTVTITLSNANDVTPGQEDWDYDDPTPGNGNAVVNWVQLNTWVGTTTSWNLTGNWTNGIPDGSKDILIPTAPAGGNFPVLDTTGNCIGLKIENGACLTESGSGTYNLEVKGDFIIEGNGTFGAGDGKVILDGNGTQSIDLGIAGSTYYNLEINKSTGTVTVSRDLTITNNLSVTGTLTSAGKTVTINGTTANNGTIQLANGIFDINGNLSGGIIDGGTGTIRFSGATFNPTTLAPNLGTIVFDNKALDQTIPALNYHHLEIDKYSGSASYTANAASSGINIDGNFKVTSGIFKADPTNAGWSHTIAGNYDINTANSEFNAGLSTITLDGISQSITQNNNSFYKLNIGNGTATPTIQMTGNLKTGGNLTVKAGSTLALNSNNGHTVGGSITIENTGRIDLTTGTAAITGGLTNSGTVDMDQASILNCNAFTNTGTGVLDFGSAASQITVSGNWDDSGTVNPGNSTINLTAGSGTITTSNSTDFYSLNINGSYTANNALDIVGNITINGSFNPGSFSHRIAGNWNDSSGTFTGGTSNIIFVGTSQSINTDVGSGNNKFYTLTIGDGTATPSVSVTSGKDLEISNNLVIRSGCQLTLNSNVVHTVGGSCTITGTLNTSTGKITISGAVTNSGSLDASSSVAASQGLKSAGLTNTGTINFGVSGSGMIECDGNWVDTGAFTLGNSTVKIIGSARTIKSNRATGDFYKLIVSGSASIDSGSSNGLDVDSTLLVNNSASLDLGTGFTNDVAATCDVGDTSTTGTLNINNSKLIVHGNLTVKNNSTLIIKGSNTAANVGELRMGNNATVYIEGSFQTNPSGSYTYKPKVTRASSGERYDFTVQNSGGIDINALIFEYAKKYGLTIASTAAITNIDIDDADFQNVEEDPTGTGQGNGARHLYIGFASGSYTGNFDTCSFDQSFGTATGNNVVCAATSGSTSLNFSNWQGNNGGGDQYEYESSGTSIIWIATNTWVGGASGHETAWNWGANWNTGSKPGAGSSVIIPSRAYAPSLNESVIIASLEVQDGGILNMSAGYQLIVNGTASIVTGTTGGKINITNSGAVLTCKSDLLDNNAAGGINQTAGKVVLLGTNSTFYSATIKTLEIGDGNQTVNINIPSGKTVKLAANGTLTVKSNAAYYLQGGTLVLGNGLTINVNSNGTFKADNNTAITTPAPGTDRFYFIVNGAVNLDTCEIRSMTANGLDIQSTAVTPTLKNISFYNHPGTSNSRYISIALANLNIDSPDCWFETITTGYNVSATGASSVIRFQDRFQKKEEQNDLITQAGSNIITSISATFTTKNVMNGDILRIEQGMDIGTYVISAVNSQTELTLTSNLTASDNGIKYSIGTMSSGRGAGEPFDYDDDSNDDGVADGTGAVVLWTYTPGTQAQGQIEGFPTIAFDLNTYAYYSTYLPSKNIQGPNTVDRIYVMDSQGAFKDYYYNIDNSYGDIVGQVWWYTEGTDHTVYFGTTGGHLFRLIDTGSELQLSPGWPLDVPGCTEITSPVITDGINLYFGGMNGVTPKIYAVVITSREVLFARTAASPVRSIPSWDMSGGTTYLFVGSDYQELAGGNDLQITAGEPYVTSTSAFFLTVGLEAGDILIISSGSQQGRYRITAVNSLTELTVNYTFTSNESGIVYSAGQTPLLYRLDISNEANDKQNNSPLDSVRAPTTYWPFTNGLYVGDYYGLMHGIDVWSATFTNTDSFPYTPAVKNSIKVMAYVMFIYHDPPNGPETRLLYADTGGYFYSLKMNGTAYDPDKGGSITPYPLLLGGGTAIESSPMPNNTGLIYIGNNDGKIFVIDESQKAVIKTFSFGSGIKIGDINYDSDNRRFLIPTDQGKIYYLENMLDPTP